MKEHKGGYKKDRAAPTATVNNAEQIRFNRSVILHTGRGSVTLTPEEAEQLSSMLTDAAHLARSRVTEGAHTSA
jgi:hypothetical protein